MKKVATINFQNVFMFMRSLDKTMNLRSLVYLAKFRRNLRLNVEELKQIQQQKMKAVITYAYENVPFYNRKFKNAARLNQH